MPADRQSESEIDRLAFEGEDAEVACVGLAWWFAVDQAFAGFAAESEFPKGQGTPGVQTASTQTREKFFSRVIGTENDARGCAVRSGHDDCARPGALEQHSFKHCQTRRIVMLNHCDRGRRSESRRPFARNHSSNKKTVQTKKSGSRSAVGSTA